MRVIETTAMPIETEPTAVQNADPPKAEGDIASRVFDLFDFGSSPVEVTIQLSLNPQLVEDLWHAWARLRGHVLLSPDGAAAIARACLAPSCNSAADVVRLVRDLVSGEPRSCQKCGRDASAYCVTCPTEPRRARRGRRH